jgi:cytochrome c biogenesis protein CcmG/thiol:disulfide interchange protein DsbE
MLRRKALLKQDEKLKALLGYWSVVLISALVLLSCQKKESPQFLKEGSKVSPITLVSLDGTHKWSLEDEKGSVVIINFWATWCPPCREEMPSLQKFYKTIVSRDNPHKKIKVITILYRDNPFSAIEFMKEMHYDFPVFKDPESKIAQLFGVTGVPETYIINGEGVLLKRIIGPFDWDSPDFKEYINNI